MTTHVYRRRPTASARKERQGGLEHTERVIVADEELENQQLNDDRERNPNEGRNDDDAHEHNPNEDDIDNDGQENNQNEDRNDNDDQDHDPNEGGNGNEDQDELLREPFPGGPSDHSVLIHFKTHVAAAIWEGREREVLRCHCLTAKLLKWKCETTSEVWRAHTRQSGLLHLRKLSYKRPNRNLITAFVERWHPETNTFHLPFGEMTITLDDVFCLIGLRVTGSPVEFVGEDVAVGIPVIRRLLGVSARDAAAAACDKSGFSIKLKWLMDKFAGSTSTNDAADAFYSGRAYLMYILGCTIFADKSGIGVNTHYLRLLEDSEVFGQYAWGAAALAYLYRQLGMTSRVGVKQISGYLTLLEAWIYEHFPTLGRPHHNAKYREGAPLAGRWMQHYNPAGSEAGVRQYREMLDSLRVEDVVWDPYQTYRDPSERPEVTFYEGCITAGDVVEPYHPDRVLRQFGLVQTIPRAPLQPNRVRRGKKPGQYRITWGITSQLFEEWDSHKLSADRRGRAASPAWTCVHEYMPWYETISHPIVQNPAHAHARVHDTHHTPFSRDGYQAAADLLAPVVARWKAADGSFSVETDMLQVEEAYEYLSMQAQSSRGRYH